MRYAKTWVISGLLGLVVAEAFFLRLILKVHGRPDVIHNFLSHLVPAAVVHTGLFLVLVLGFKIRARGASVFWLLSAALLLSFGGWACAGAFVMILAFGYVAARIGGVAAHRLFPAEALGWHLSLALGILCISAAGAYLAIVHLFKWWVLALLVIAVLVVDLREHPSPARRIREAWSAFSVGWDPALGLALQVMFLLGAYAFVVAMAPETNSDAVRFYWPFIRLMRHYSGFIDMPRQWSYIIPQAGIPYAAAVFILLGKHAVRLAMLLAWAALVGLVCRRRRERQVGAGHAIALVVASCPAILWVSTSLMLDTFVCLTVVTLALLCLEGLNPETTRFWAAVGACAGTAWAAKYSTLAYAVPLVIVASIRSFRAAGWGKTVRGLAVAGACAVLTPLPWFIQSYRECGNPVFPFFLNVLPAPLWPRGVGFSNLDSFRLAPSWRAWLLAPVDITFHTRRFVEGLDGLAGLALLILLVLAIAAIWKGTAYVRTLVLCAATGTALLLWQTAYLRYWLPGLWLAAIAAGRFLDRELPRSLFARLTILASACAVMLPQVLLAMLNYWQDPKGWAWDVYSGKISSQAYLGTQYPEFETIEKLGVFGHDWPKTWFTGYDGAGHLQVQPMEATVWEISLHANEPRTKIQYLCTAGCRYWIVDENGEDAYWVKAIGISQFFWNAANRVARVGSIAIYRMPGIKETLRDFDARAAPGVDLVMDGGFETGEAGRLRFWRPSGEAGWVYSNPEVPLSGAGALRLSPGGGVRQDVALPPGVHSVEFSVAARSCSGSRQALLNYRTNVSGFNHELVPGKLEDWIEPYQFLSGNENSVRLGAEWQVYRQLIPLPARAKYVTILLNASESGGAAFVDEVHLYSR